MRRRCAAHFLAVLLILGATGCDEAPTAQNDEPVPPSVERARGFGFSPRGFPNDFSNTEAFFDEVEGLERGVVMGNTLWRDDAENGADAGTIPELAELVGQAAASHDFAPLTVLGWRSGEEVHLAVPDNATDDWTNEQARAAFLEMVEAYASDFQPAYLLLGNETDMYAEQDPEDYGRWIEFYKEARGAIQAVSPETKVGTVFQVEHMMGTGSLVGWTGSHTDAYTRHDPATLDVVGLTVYPFLGIRSPENVPSDYLDAVFDLIGETPVLITETGWPAGSFGANVPWSTGEPEQVTYLERLAAMLSDREVPVVNWLFLHPLRSGASDEAIRTFGAVSVRDTSGNKRLVYEDWAAFE